MFKGRHLSKALETLFLPVIVIIVLLCVCCNAEKGGARSSGNKMSNGEQKPESGKVQMKNERDAHSRLMKCEIRSDKTDWDRRYPINLSILIENVSDATLNVYAFLRFELSLWRRKSNPDTETDLAFVERNTYIGVDSVDRSTNPRITLEKGGSVSYKVDLSRMGWSRLNSALLPTEKIFEIVPQGRYKLCLNLHLSSDNAFASDDKVVKSNVVEIEIK